MSDHSVLGNKEAGMLRIRVAVAVIVSEHSRILIARRSDEQHQGGLWEFPGGKIEPGESTADALVRELAEEVGMDTFSDQMTPLTEVVFDYPDKHVCLEVLWVAVTDEQAAIAHGAEGQPIAWVAAREIHDYAFPEANAPILDAVLARLDLA